MGDPVREDYPSGVEHCGFEKIKPKIMPKKEGEPEILAIPAEPVEKPAAPLETTPEEVRDQLKQAEKESEKAEIPAVVGNPPAEESDDDDSDGWGWEV